MTIETKTYDLVAVSVALSPLTHNSGSEGNETLVMTESVWTAGGVARVPCLSGNALRHCTVREPGAEHLVSALGLSGELPIEAAQFLFNGGALYDSGPTENVGLIRDFWRLFPLGRVLGGALPHLIIGGSLQCWRGTLVCRENLSRLRMMTPGDWFDGIDDLRGAHEFVGAYQYTRGDAVRQHADKTSGVPDGPSPLMIFAGQTVMAGSVFVHGYRLAHALPRDFGALLDAVGRWNRDSQRIGGASGKGHGRLALAVHGVAAQEAEDAIGAYREHVETVADEARQWLHEQFIEVPRLRGEAKKAKASRAKAKKGSA